MTRKPFSRWQMAAIVVLILTLASLAVYVLRPFYPHGRVVSFFGCGFVLAVLLYAIGWAWSYLWERSRALPLWAVALFFVFGFKLVFPLVAAMAVLLLYPVMYLTKRLIRRFGIVGEEPVRT